MGVNLATGAKVSLKSLPPCCRNPGKEADLELGDLALPCEVFLRR